jgi:hypothetical protein
MASNIGPDLGCDNPHRSTVAAEVKGVLPYLSIDTLLFEAEEMSSKFAF